MINLGNGKYRPLEEINSALRLQGLVKRDIIRCSSDELNCPANDNIATYLKFIVKES